MGISNKSQKPDSQEAGQMLILFALSLPVLMGMMALVIDFGMIAHERRSLQNAVDAAALAGAIDLMDGETDTVKTSALSYMDKNGYSDILQTTAVNLPPLEGKFAGNTAYVEVKASHHVKTFFLGIFIDKGVSVSARAVALGRTGDADTIVDGSCEDGKKVKKDKNAGKKDKNDKKDKGKECVSAGSSAKAQNVPLSDLMPDCGSNPTIDGRVDEYDGDKALAELGDGSGIRYGQVYFCKTATRIHFAMELDALYKLDVANENVYGDSEYHTQHQTGWGKHSFGQLIGSDRAHFALACGDTYAFLMTFLKGIAYRTSPQCSRERHPWATRV